MELPWSPAPVVLQPAVGRADRRPSQQRGPLDGAAAWALERQPLAILTARLPAQVPLGW